MFCIARDSFIETHFPKRPLRVYLHNPLWHLHDDHERREEMDRKLADFAVKWWAGHGLKINLNTSDGSFDVCERHS